MKVIGIRHGAWQARRSSQASEQVLCTAPEKSFLHRSEEKRLCTVKEILRLSGWLPDSVEKNLRLLSCLYSCETYLSSRRTHLPSCLFSNFLGPRKCTFSPAAVMKMASFSDSFLAGIWFGCGRTFNWSHSSVLPHEGKKTSLSHMPRRLVLQCFCYQRIKKRGTA